MLRNIIAGSLLIAFSSAMASDLNPAMGRTLQNKDSNAKRLLFAVQSSPKGTQAPITICLDVTKKNRVCQNYTASLSEIGIIAMKYSGNDKVYNHAGIRLDAKGYKIEGCKPLNNGFCEFKAATNKTTVIKLSPA